jgi:hypothetical protein
MSKNGTALIAALAIALTGAAQAANQITPPAVPDNLVADGKPILRGHAVGTQNYICVAAATPTGGDWFFIGPQATVFDENGQQILTHFLSPNPENNALQATWQHSRDSSVVWATKLRGSTDANYVAPGAIEWLLLDVTGAQVGPSGGVKVSTANQIQRVNTVGGVKPPASECTSATLTNRRYVPYEADYYFYQ